MESCAKKKPKQLPNSPKSDADTKKNELTDSNDLFISMTIAILFVGVKFLFRSGIRATGFEKK